MDPWRLEPAHDLGLRHGQRMRSLRREIGTGELLAHRAWRIAVRSYLALYHRLAMHGREHLDHDPPFVVVANHVSHLDALIVAGALPRRNWGRVFPIAAGDTFFETPLLSSFAGVILNALPMWRRNCGSHALREMRERLAGEPCGYILFPEGTRSRTGATGPFRPGLGMIIAGTDVPVIPGHLHGAFEALPPGCKLPRPRRITARFGPPLRFADVANDKEGWKEVARRAEYEVRKLALGEGTEARRHEGTQ